MRLPSPSGSIRHPRPRRAPAGVWLTLPLLLATACLGITEPALEPLVASYRLSTVNGAPLPWVQQQADPQILLVSDRLVTTAAGTFTQTTTRSTSTGGGAPTTASAVATGSYRRIGANVGFNFDSGVSGLGVLGANDLTIAFGTMTFVYLRE